MIRRMKILKKVLTFVNKKEYNEYNSSGYLISTIIKNVSRNPICELNGQVRKCEPQPCLRDINGQVKKC